MTKLVTPAIIQLTILDFDKLFDSFGDDKKPDSPKKQKKMVLEDSEDEIKKFSASLQPKLTNLERKRSSPRDSPKASLRKDSKSKNAVKSAVFNKIDREDSHNFNNVTIRKKDQLTESFSEKNNESIPKYERIGPDGKYLIPNAELNPIEVKRRYKKLFFVWNLEILTRRKS